MDIEARVTKAYTAPAVERAVDVLQMLRSNPGGVTLSQIAISLQLPKSTALGILSSLERKRMVTRDHTDRRYRLGVGLFELGQAYLNELNLVDRFTAVGQEMVAVCDENVYLATLDGGESLYVAKVETSQPVRVVSELGRRLPATCTAAGKALLACLPEAELEEVLGSGPLPQMTARSAADRAMLEVELTQVRTQGFAESLEECVTGFYSVAAPVLDHRGRGVAAVSIWAPTSRLTDDRRRELVALTVRGTSRLSEALGAQPHTATAQMGT